MAFETHGFMTGGPKKILEDFGHIGLGLLPLDLLLWLREEFQLPPENDRYPVFAVWTEGGYHCYPVDPDSDNRANIERAGWDEYWSAARVGDMRRHELGYAIGAQLRPAVVVSLTLWAVGWW